MLDRRAFGLLGLNMLAGGCVTAKTRQWYSSNEPGDLDLKSLGDKQGLVVGNGIYASAGTRYKIPPASDWLGPRQILILAAKSNWIKVDLSHHAGEPFNQDGATLWPYPFAQRLEVGRWRATHAQLSFFSLYSTAGITSQWSFDFHLRSPVEFEVLPGKVTYFGRLGMLDQNVVFPDAQTRDRMCPRDRYTGNPAVGLGCTFRKLFIESNPSFDLPLIGARFPDLERTDIVIAPAKTGPGGPQSLARTLANPSYGRV